MVKTIRKEIKLSQNPVEFKKSTLNCEDGSYTSLLPDYFNSDLSENDDFWGFPSDAAELNISSACMIRYRVSQRGELLFHGDLYDEEFNGFTREEVSLTILPPTGCTKQNYGNVYFLHSVFVAINSFISSIS